MSPQKENVKGASAPNSELPEQSGETLPDGGDIGVAELRALAAENAAADEAELRTAYEQVFTALVEIPAAWATFTPADRQGALQVGWLRYCANSHRLSGLNSEYVPVLALGWQDDECRSWIEAQIAESHWRKARYEKFDAVMESHGGRTRSHAGRTPSTYVDAGRSHGSHGSHAPDTSALPEIPPGAPFPVRALGKFAAAAQAVHDVVQAPLPICAAGVLASLSVCVQGVYDVVLDGRVEPTSLFLLTIAPSGARKTAADAVIFKAIRAFDRENGGGYRQDLLAHKREIAQRAGGKGGPPPEPPADPRILFTDGTAEAIQRDAHKGKYGTRALVSDEGGRFLGGYSMTAERQLAGLGVFSGLWDAGEITVRRMRDDSTFTLYDRRLALHVQAQAVVVKGFLTDPVVAAQGLLGRFLVAQVDHVAAREYNPANPLTDPGVEQLHVAHRLLLQDIIESQDIDLGVVRRTLTLTPAACSYWRVVHDGLEVERDRAADDALAAFYGKAPAHVLRVSGVLAAAHGERQVGVPRIRDAAEIVLWYAGDLRRAQDVADVSECDRHALAMRRWLGRHKGETLTIAAIQRGAPRGIRQGGAVRVRAVLKRLIDTGSELTATKEGGFLVGACI